MKKSSNINWGVASFLILYQIIVICTLPVYFYYYTPSMGIILSAVFLYFAAGLSITGGYHRLFSHRSYKANPIIETILLFFGSTALQGSALRWCYDHRIHHAHVDTDKDPYSIKKGFMYAHFLWLMYEQHPIEDRVIKDLTNNKRVMFQHNHDLLCMFGSNILVVALVGWLFNDFVGAVVLAFGVRVLFLHHCTWFINSLAHTWGDKPFSEEHSAVNNYIISFLTFGEGYHNYHHTFAHDYRNGVRWYQFDPTKWLIWTLNKLGLAKGLKRVDEYTIQKKLVQEGKNLLLERLSDAWYDKKEEMELKIQELSDSLMVEFGKIKELTEKYKSLRTSQSEQDTLKQLQQEIANLQAKTREDWRKWVKLSRSVMHLKPAQA